jgi:tRNA pseudouridine38-40 synthase
MPRFKLTLAYDGAGFVGWQRQASGTSIQGTLEAVLEELDGREVGVAAAGRTDAGVHARGQVVSLSLERPFEPGTLRRALNAHLPDTIRVLTVETVPARFHARFDARAKTYCYRIWNDEVLDPFERWCVWHVPAPILDVDAMRAAARGLVGRHDFASFQGTGSTTPETVRELFGFEVSSSGPLITYRVRGSGFLRHMVRNIAGTLVDVGAGRRAADEVDALIAARDRTQAGRTAPPQGLFLMNVEYDAAATSLAAER